VLHLGRLTAAGTAVNGVNYIDVSGTFNWGAGDSKSKSFTIPIMSDGVYNMPLTVNLSLSPTGGGLPFVGAMLSIHNNDPKPTVTLTSVDRYVPESAGTVYLNAVLSQATPLPVRVPFIFTGTAIRQKDYRFDLDVAGHAITAITFPPNTTSSKLAIHVIDDSLNESNETLIATIATPSNANLGAVTSNTITIQDNDPLPTVTFAAAAQIVVEGSKGVGVAIPAALIKLSAASSMDISVPVNLSSGGADARISLTNPVVIPAGQTHAYAVSVADDAIHEGSKTFGFALGTPSHAMLGAQQTTSLRIRDNE
jgi:hypothetical protein